MKNNPVDSDPEETREWLDALESVVRVEGHERALALLRFLEEQAQQHGIVANVPPYSAYRNTIPVESEGLYPGDLGIEERITSIVRWNALAMVVRANVAYGELGGHMAATRRLRRSSKSVSTTSFGRTRVAAATWCSSSRIRRRASMRARFWKGGFPKRTWRIFGRRLAGRACRRIRTPG